VARALAAAIVVSLLAVSGAGSSDAQTPKRGGTLVFRIVGLEPACPNVFDARCNPGSLRHIAEKVLERPFVVGPDLTFRSRLVSRVDETRKRPFTLIYRIRPEAQWSDGVRLTARDFVFTLQAIRRHGNPLDRQLHSVVRQIRAVDAKTLRVVLRSRYAGWRELFRNVLPAHALRGEDLTKVWSDRIENPKTGRPIGRAPSSSNALSADARSCSAGIRASEDLISLTSSGSWSDSHRARTIPRRCCGGANSTSPRWSAWTPCQRFVGNPGSG
jgi:ABC-type transport system substrate-binding protein